MIVRPISETNVDITPAEIMAAQREGRNVYFLFDEEVYVPLLIALSEFAVFSINSAENTLEITVYEDSSFKITETSFEDRVNELINAGVETSFAPVIVTVDSDNNTNISADEIKAAYESGKSVFLSLGSDYIPLYAAYKNADADANNDGNRAVFRFYMDSIVSADFIVRHNKMTVRDFPYALKSEVPTKVSQLENDLKYVESSALETLLEPFPVFVDIDTNTVTSTAEEILTAYCLSKNVFLVVDNKAVPFTSFTENPAIALFEHVVDDGIERFLVVADTVHKQKIPIPTDDHINGLIEDKMGGEYELIETITLEEGMARIERTKEPDGALYNFEAAKILIYSPPNDIVGRSAQVFFGDNANPNYLYGFVATTPSTNDKHNTSVMYAEKVKGYWRVIRMANPNNTIANPNGSVYSGTSETIPSYRNELSVSKMPMISRIVIIGYAGGYVDIPAGVTIEIWGVRANA